MVFRGGEVGAVMDIYIDTYIAEYHDINIVNMVHKVSTNCQFLNYTYISRGAKVNSVFPFTPSHSMRKKYM